MKITERVSRVQQHAFDQHFLDMREKQTSSATVRRRDDFSAIVAQLGGQQRSKRVMADWIIDQERPSLPVMRAQGTIGKQEWREQGAVFSRGTLVNGVFTLVASDLEEACA